MTDHFCNWPSTTHHLKTHSATDAVKRQRRYRRSGHHSLFKRGLGAVKALREQCPDKIIVAAGRSPMPVKRSRNRRLAQALLDDHHLRRTARDGGKRPRDGQRCGGEIQIELFGNWTLDDAVTGIVLACGRRFIIAVATRSQRATVGRSRSCTHEGAFRHGLELSITGGITPADLPLFKVSA